MMSPPEMVLSHLTNSGSFPLLGLKESHHVAKFLADFLDLMRRFLLPHFVKVGTTLFVLVNPFLRELAALDFGQNLLHALLRVGIDNARVRASSRRIRRCR